MIGAIARRVPWPVPDLPMLGAALCLLGIGLVMVASASVATAESLTGDPLYFFFRQLAYALIGVLGAALALFVPSRAWEHSGFMLLAFAVFLLLLVLIPGVGLEVNSARRWIDLGLVRVQASEPARLAMILYLAGYIVRHQIELQHRIRGVIKALVPVGAACMLLLSQPDYGATAVLLSITFVMLFLGGARLGSLLAIGASVAAALAILATTAPYRLARLLSFRDPWADINNSGWQLAQSLIAIGRGEIDGVGLGNSVQKLLYLPEQHTDFIFAIYAEELGTVGVAVLLSLFAVVVWRGFVIAATAERLGDRFQAYMVYGISFWFGAQALINIAVNTGLVPTKGLTLPLISFGGSSLVVTCVALALVMRVGYENRRRSAEQPLGVSP